MSFFNYYSNYRHDGANCHFLHLFVFLFLLSPYSLLSTLFAVAGSVAVVVFNLVSPLSDAQRVPISLT